ncbi:MAG: DUF2087 domain-containing protein [Pseudorhodobacter sp.]|nr:DUF2087 domain-containing protein [Pseudorhodobacter sp.]
MTRTPLPLDIQDLSSFARALHRELQAPEPLGHLSLLNRMSRAAGFRNLQHLRASAKAGRALATPTATPDLTRVQAALRHFDAQGRLATWPSRTAIQHLCLWALWSRLPQVQPMTERQISARLTEHHLFGDPAILRRTLVELKLVSRSPDCTDYRRVGRPPPPEAVALIRHLRAPSAPSRPPAPRPDPTPPRPAAAPPPAPRD